MAGAATRPVPPPEAAAGASAVDQRTARWVMQLDDCWCVAGCLWLALIGGCDCGPFLIAAFWSRALSSGGNPMSQLWLLHCRYKAAP